jgi:hypothetical protein
VGGKRVVELMRCLMRHEKKYQYRETFYCIRKGMLAATARWWWRWGKTRICMGRKPFLLLRIARIVSLLCVTVWEGVGEWSRGRVAEEEEEAEEDSWCTPRLLLQMHCLVCALFRRSKIASVLLINFIPYNLVHGDPKREREREAARARVFVWVCINAYTPQLNP